MKCPNCNAEIKEGSIICPMCNTQFAFAGSDNFINLPDDEFVIKSSGVEEYVDPHENEDKPINTTPGTLNLKTNKPQPKKVIKKVVKVNTQPVEDETVEIKPEANYDPNDEASIKEEQNLETTVVTVGGFTNTIVDATSVIKEEPAQQVSATSNNLPPVQSNVDPGVFAPTTNQATGVQLIQNVDLNTSTIGQVVETEEVKEEKKPRKKMNETMMIAFIMGLIVILLCFIVYILLQNNNNPNNAPTTTTMTTFNCEENECSTTTTTTTESTTTTKPINQGVNSSIAEPVSLDSKSVCSLQDPNKPDSYPLVDITIDRIYTAEEAAEYMKNYDNKTYRPGLTVGVLQYTLTGNELPDGLELKPITNVSFYTDTKEKKFNFNGEDFYIGFFGNSNDTLTNKKQAIVTGYYNYPADQPPAYVCIGHMDGTKACFKLR